MTKNKIEELKEKIQKDMDKIKLLEQQRNGEIAKLISRIDLNIIDDETLIGAILYIKQQCSTNPQVKEEWSKSGRTFLKRKPKSGDQKSPTKKQ